jgi:hypothetical protein
MRERNTEFLRGSFEVLLPEGSGLHHYNAVRFHAARTGRAGGSTPNVDSEILCDASIMDGRTLDAGAAAGVGGVRNPVLLGPSWRKATPTPLARGDFRGIAVADLDYYLSPDCCPRFSLQ